MDHLESDPNEAEADEVRPPSIPQNLWDRVPRERRREAVEAAARGLRKAVHPEHTVVKLLDEWGLAEVVPPPPPPEPIQPGVPAFRHPFSNRK